MGTHPIFESDFDCLTEMAASAVYILDLKGKVLISRNYRGDMPLNIIEKFPKMLMEAEEEGTVTPVMTDENVTFIHIKCNNIYVVCTTSGNANVMCLVSFMHKLCEVFAEYFKEVAEVRPPSTVTNAVSWRSEGVKYRKNEVFLDVVESVDLLVSATGNVLRSEIVGAVKMRVYLSGMPELRLGLNDKILFESTGRTKKKSVELDDVKFHQCVRLSRFDNDRTISFIPPDGEFELMSYRLQTQIKPLVWVESHIEKHAHSRVEIMVKARSQFKRRSTANNVEILVPVPSDADSPKFR